MAIVRFTRSEISDEPKNVDWERLAATTEEEIEAQAREDGSADFDLTAVHADVPYVDPRALRERLSLSLEAFACRYRLAQRTIGQWEQGDVRLSEEARVLLYAIDRDPDAIARALRRDD